MSDNETMNATDNESAISLTDTPVMHMELASGGGSALVGFIQEETGAILRTVQDKLRDVLSVRDFGAIGNNVADDTAAFQAALMAASASNLYVPAGSYKITSPLTASATTFIYGEGNKSTYLFFTLPPSSSASLLSVNAGSGGVNSYGFGFADLSIIDQTPTPNTTGIYVENVVDGLIQNVDMTGMHVGLSFSNGQNRIVNLEISTLGGNLASAVGVLASGNACGVGIYDSIVQSSPTLGEQIGIGYLFEGGASPTMHSANTYGCSIGCQLTVSGETMYWPELVSCQFDTGSNTGLLINPGEGGSIYGLSCQNIWCGTMGGYGVNIVPGSGTINGLQFIGGRIYNNSNVGILIEGGLNISVCGMHISGNGAGAAPGIAVSGEVTGLIIDGNKIGQSAQFANTQNYGIQLWGDAITNATITGNDLSGNISDGLSNASISPASVWAAGNIGYSANSFIAPTLTNSWVNNGGTTATTYYYKDASSVVHIQGVIKSGVIAEPAFALPQGFRPGTDQYFASTSNGSFGYAYIQASTGNVIPQAGSNVWFSLCGISFKAEQ